MEPVSIAKLVEVELCEKSQARTGGGGVRGDSDAAFQITHTRYAIDMHA